jgi:hypothetical protein
MTACHSLWTAAKRLNSCGAITRRDCRLLLTNDVIGIAVPADAIQLGPHLLAGEEMGEDALRVLNDIIPLQAAIRADVTAEPPHFRQTTSWAARLDQAFKGNL